VSISPKNLRAAFTLADTESAKKTDDLTVFFEFSESSKVKAAHKTLVKLTPGPSQILKSSKLNLSWEKSMFFYGKFRSETVRYGPKLAEFFLNLS